jgi:N-methylhydantoinase A
MLVPLGAGVGATFGFLVAPLAFDFVRSYYGQIEELDWAHVNTLLDEMEREGRDILATAGVAPEDVTIARDADLRYVGQGHEVRVPLPTGALSGDTVAVLRDTFERVYRALYERTAGSNPVEALSWRVVVTGPQPHLPLERLGASAGLTSDAARAVKGARAIYLPEDRAMATVPVYDRYVLGPGAVFTGPAVIEERESTCVVGRGATARVDDMLNLLVEL